MGNMEGRAAPLLETPRNMSRKALEMKHLPLYRGSIRAVWREGS
jgi:hypothetical protein